jgi:uncharacterized protein
MTLFVDTSALYAVLDAADGHHAAARQVWQDLVAGGETLLCHNYVLVEIIALIQNRIGLDGIKTFHEDILPVLTVQWVDDQMHHASAAALLIANRRQLSLVDCVSFETMRRLGLRSVFAFDAHFKEQGFQVFP